MLVNSREVRILFAPCLIIVILIYQITITTNIENTTIQKSNAVIAKLENKIACHDKGVLPSGGFCLDINNAFTGGNIHWDGKLCAGLEDLFGKSSVGDFGAGLGWYGTCFLRIGGSFIITPNKEHKAKLQKVYDDQMTPSNLKGTKQVIRSYEAFDGALNVGDLTNEKIKYADLSIPFELDHKFDWVLSLEVGEHIAKEKEAVFINNLVNHACKGIVLSWAVIGQGGYNHINNQNNDYVVARMKGVGLLKDEEATTTLRKLVTVPWFKNTVMVYRFPKPRC